MRIIKFILINLFIFGFIFFSISLLFPSIITTSKSINIAISKRDLFTAIKNKDNWKNWNEFLKQKNTLASIEKMEGDSLIFASMQNGREQLPFLLGVDSTLSDSSTLHFSLIQKNHWYQPLKKFATLFSESKYGYPIEKSLSNFKQQLDSMHPINKSN